jgi:hypothetical protein
MRLSVASRLAGQWVARLRELQASLNSHPNDWSAWRWHIHVKILIYLVRRYGADPALDAKSHSLDVYASSWGQPPSTHRRIRSRAELCAILMRVAEINACKPISRSNSGSWHR